MMLTVWSDAVRRARHEKRIGRRRVLGYIDRSEEMNTIAHSDSVFVPGVVRLYIKGLQLPFLRKNGEDQQLK
jgi:hypothetical protein